MAGSSSRRNVRSRHEPPVAIHEPSESEYEDEEEEVDTRSLVYFADISQGEQEGPRPAWIPDHAWLYFPDHSGELSQAQMYGRLHAYYNCKFDVIRSLKPTCAVTTALLRRVEEYLFFMVRDHRDRDLFRDPSFGNLIRLNFPVSQVLVLEFFGTLEVDPFSTDYESDEFVSFRLGGQFRQCSLFEFGRRIGLYTRTTSTTVFKTHLVGCLATGSEDFDAADFWPTVGTGPYRPNLRVSQLRTRPLRLLAKLIITHLMHRSEADKMNKQDLFYLWCFVTGRPLNLPLILLLQLCRRGVLFRDSSPIHSCHLITALAESYHVSYTGIVTNVAAPLNINTLSNAKFIQRTENNQWVLREALLEDVAEPAPPAPPRNRARLASQSSVDQLITQFVQFGSQLSDFQSTQIGIQDTQADIQNTQADIQRGIQEVRHRVCNIPHFRFSVNFFFLGSLFPTTRS